MQQDALDSEDDFSQRQPQQGGGEVGPPEEGGAAAAAGACPVCGVELSRVSCTTRLRGGTQEALFEVEGPEGAEAAQQHRQQQPQQRGWQDQAQEEEQQDEWGEQQQGLEQQLDGDAGGGGEWQQQEPEEAHLGQSQQEQQAQLEGDAGGDEWLEALQTQMWEEQQADEEGGAAGRAAGGRGAHGAAGAATGAGLEPPLERWLRREGLEHLAALLRLAGAAGPEDVADMLDGDLRAAGVSSSAERQALLAAAALLPASLEEGAAGSEDGGGGGGEEDGGGWAQADDMAGEDGGGDAWMWEGEGPGHAPSAGAGGGAAGAPAAVWGQQEEWERQQDGFEEWPGQQQQQERRQDEAAEAAAGGEESEGDDEDVQIVGEHPAAAARAQQDAAAPPAVGARAGPASGDGGGGGSGGGAPGAALRPFNSMFAGGRLPSWLPAWQSIPGTGIVVDCFTQASRQLPARSWILTHFHADHYGGLTKGFRQGVIYCTPATAALVRLRIKTGEAHLKAVPLGQEVAVEGTRITFLDANHCPGSAMVAAFPPGAAPPVLHTGDARLSRAATRACPVLESMRGRSVLVLDTTYADPQYAFPPQEDVVASVVRAVKARCARASAESFNPRTLFLFGSYTIGKERLFLSAAAALGKKLYVAAAKRAVLGCVDLAPDFRALLTTDHLETNVHAVPMRQVTMEAMEALLLRYKGRYTTVVGFCPTGWSQVRESKGLKRGRRNQSGTVVLYQVPYSEHSSFAELRDFVGWFRPLRIIPSVNNDRGGAKCQAMLRALTGDRGPMDAFSRATAAAGGGGGGGGGGEGAAPAGAGAGGGGGGRGQGGLWVAAAARK
ncbi:MAG: beta-lactamase-like protein [Monoraphidium minutum]|nr:MAG: beta-lactamase-like protein [Monoraphidium minutum]